MINISQDEYLFESNHLTKDHGQTGVLMSPIGANDVPPFGTNESFLALFLSTLVCFVFKQIDYCIDRIPTLA